MLAWSLGLFALLRSSWVEGRILLPLAQLQKQAADHYAGAPSVPVAATLECSGADVLALGLAAILAWPVSWRTRLTGALGVVAFVLGLNTVRIATLGHAAASPGLFRVLHLEVWPSILLLATAAYVFAWMRARLAAARQAPDGGNEASALAPLARRFAFLAAGLLVVFVLAAPWFSRSESLVQAGGWTARAAALVLSSAGLAATVSGNLLTTSRGAFMVTPECLATALVPLYLAGVLAVHASWPWRALALAGALPLFALLAIARLLVLALPPALAASPLHLVHAFHQLALVAAGVAVLALWREPRGARSWTRAAGRASAALGAAAVLAFATSAALSRGVFALARAVAPHAPSDLVTPADAQGALALLPAYQLGLLLAVGLTASVGWRRMLPAFGVLLASQVVFLVALGEMAAHAGVVMHALVIRAWAVAVPVVLSWLLLRAEGPVVGTAPPLVVVDGHG
jgi:exosortase/archaeosortase family protein